MAQRRSFLIQIQFGSFGKLRERIKIEAIGTTNASKAVVTYIKNESSEDAVQKGPKKWEIHTLELRKFISKESNTHRIFASGLRVNVNDQELEEAFGIFGKISEKSLMPSKKAQCTNAVIGYDDE